MKEIEASNRRGVMILVSDEDYDALKVYRWRVDRKGYAYANIGKRKTSMHRLLLCPPLGMVCDHIDGNPLRNTRDNLRVCTPQQNVWNSKKPDGYKSPFKGVRRDRILGYTADIQAHGEYVYLGSFGESALLASWAYDLAAIEYFGEFARLNHPHLKEKYLEAIRFYEWTRPASQHFSKAA